MPTVLIKTIFLQVLFQLPVYIFPELHTCKLLHKLNQHYKYLFFRYKSLIISKQDSKSYRPCDNKLIPSKRLFVFSYYWQRMLQNYLGITFLIFKSLRQKTLEDSTSHCCSMDFFNRWGTKEYFDFNIKQTNLISENELLCICYNLKISSYPLFTVLVDYMDMVPCLE